MPDLTDLLTDTARGPYEFVDPHEIVHRARRRVRRRRAIGGVSAAVLLLVGGATALQWLQTAPAEVILQPGPSDPLPTGPAPLERQSPAPPSQSPEDASRDGVVPEVAALPFDRRVQQVRWWDGAQRAETTEGVWIVSGLSQAVLRAAGDPPVLGDADGQRSRDFIQVYEYGELLLLDANRTRIKRAFPFSGYPPQSLVVTDDAVYCAKQGDGGLPNSMLCRVDRATFELTVRVFPHDGPDSDGKGYGSEPEEWIIEGPVDKAVFGVLSVGPNGEIYARSSMGRVRVDPDTLEISDFVPN